MDADARLSPAEFANGLKPEEPYSRAHKRSMMKNGTNNSTHRRGARTGLSLKGGHIMMLKDSQRDDVKRLAMDRQHSQNRKGLQIGTTPMKSRPIIAQDLSQLCSPKHTIEAAKSKKSSRAREEYQMAYDAMPSARSRKSSRSLNRSKMSTMKRHASAIAGGRRKKDQKPAKSKKLKKSKSKKSLKRQGSMDDVLINRLAKPVDHTALKKRIKKEQELELRRQRPTFLKRSRSRSAKKKSDSLEKSFRRKYKTFVNKLGKTDSDDDQFNGEDESQWRGINDFTRLTGPINEESDEKRGSLRESKRISKEHSNRKRSNSEKKRKLSSRDFLAPREFL